MTIPTPADVLIIEDQLLIAIHVEQLALDVGAREVTVMRSREALQFIPGSGFTTKVAVVDHMSAGDDAQAIADLVGASHARLIVMTTHRDQLNGPLFYVAETVIGKPFADEDMRAALRHALAPAEEA